jgi:ATP-dependent DNA helicase RecQ
MIKLLNENFEYNPIRSHINITFSSVNNNEDKVNLIVEDLVKNNFDKKKSKVLVFVSYRFKAEESAEELKKLFT